MEKSIIKKMLIAWCIVMVVVSGYLLWGKSNPQGGVVSTNEGETQETLPSGSAIFQLVDLNGRTIPVGGRMTVVNFWATWCPPCREELPELVRFAEYAAVKGIPFYAVDIQEKSQDVRAFLNSKGYRLPVLLDSSGQVARQYRVSAIPTTIVLDAKGGVLFKKTGTTTFAELKAVVDQRL